LQEIETEASKENTYKIKTKFFSFYLFIYYYYYPVIIII